MSMKQFEIKADGISAKIISFGAALQGLLVKDRDGNDKDVVVGYDDPEQYTKIKSFNGAIIGRYTNRIAKGTFSIDGQEYHIPLSEANRVALHGGNKGWDQRHWDLVSQSASSLTLGLFDEAGSEGFPGSVQAYITYTLAPNPSRLTVRIVALSLDQRTPIMPTTHTFFTLSGFSNPTVLNDTLHLPNATSVVDVDDILVPTGKFNPVKGQFLDYTNSKKVSADAKTEFQGSNIGLDHAFIFDKDSVQDKATQLVWSNETTGIRMTLKTNQAGMQIYSGAHLNGSTSVKASQKGLGSDSVQKFSCLAIEPQDYIDGVNHPEWKREDKQIFGPGDGPCVNWTEYAFDTI